MCRAPGGALFQLPMPALMPVPAAAETGERGLEPGAPWASPWLLSTRAHCRLCKAAPLHFQSSHTTGPSAGLCVPRHACQNPPVELRMPLQCAEREKQSQEGKGGVCVTQQAGGRASLAPKLPLSCLQSAQCAPIRAQPEPPSQETLPECVGDGNVSLLQAERLPQGPRTCCSLCVGGSPHPQGLFSQDTQVSAHKGSSSEWPVLTLFCCSLHLNFP